MPHHKHGFTIIEVSLVLAIAGLILVMAFVALPALQRQTRDSKRKEDTMTFLQALKKYQQNNRGQLPKVSLSSYGDDKNSIITERYDEEDFDLQSWRQIDPTQDNPWVNFYLKYLGENFLNPDGTKYTFLIQDPDEGWHKFTDIISETFDDRFADLYIFINATCENGEPTYSKNNRNLAIVAKLETGTYCANL